MKCTPKNVESWLDFQGRPDAEAAMFDVIRDQIGPPCRNTAIIIAVLMRRLGLNGALHIGDRSPYFRGDNESTNT